MLEVSNEQGPPVVGSAVPQPLLRAAAEVGQRVEPSPWVGIGWR